MGTYRVDVFSIVHISVSLSLDRFSCTCWCSGGKFLWRCLYATYILLTERANLCEWCVRSYNQMRYVNIGIIFSFIGIPNDVYTLLSQILIGCSLLSHE